MPMDIRSFFAKKPGKVTNQMEENVNVTVAASSNKNNSNSTSNNNSNVQKTVVTAKKDNDSGSRRTSAGTAAAKTVPKGVAKTVTSSSSQITNKRNNFMEHDDDDDDDEDQKVGSNRTASARKRRVIPVDDHDSDDAAGDDDDFDDDDNSDSDYDAPHTKRSPAKKPRTSTSNASSRVSTPNKQGSPTPRSTIGKKRYKNDNDDDDDDDDDVEDYVDVDDVKEQPFNVFEKSSPSKQKSSMTTQTRKVHPTSSPSPTKRIRNSTTTATTTPSSTSKKSNGGITLLDPTLVEIDSFDVDSVVVPECLAGITFVFTGILDNLDRDVATDLIKALGGRVTTAVSGKTNYLVVGQVLEDGRPYQEGTKYKKASSGDLHDKIKIVLGSRQLYGLCQQYQQLAMKEKGIPWKDTLPLQGKSVSSNVPLATKESVPSVVNANAYGQKPAPGASFAVAKGTPAANPISKPSSPPVSNPYARKVNPYLKSAPTTGEANLPITNPSSMSGNPYGKAPVASSTPSTTVKKDADNSLWVDRYAPTSSRDILGNKNNVQKLQSWLQTWEKVFNNPKNSNKTFSSPNGPWKAALLSGPPGIGKTTTATLVAKEAGRDLLEFNASDARSKKALQETMGDLTGSQSISFLASSNNQTKSKSKVQAKKRCVIMDEVDGMGAGDRSGMAELIQMIKKSKIPIICICNDRQSQKIKSLLPYCMDLKFSRPPKNVLANRAVRIAEMEGLVVERNAAEAIAESCGNDVRQVLNLLQMWASKERSEALTYRALKDRESNIQKDEILRVSLFDAAKSIVEGRQGLQQADAKAQLNNLFKRSDAFFVDYSMVGLIVQQNYLRVLQGQYGKTNQTGGPAPGEPTLLERMHQASMSMSDYDLAENQIRGGDGNWGLLPTAAILAVKCGYHAGGEGGGFLGGFPEFTSWMGKNSTMGKNYRLLNELNYHISQKVSANSQELRQTYIPMMRERILMLLKKGDQGSVAEVINIMDEYGLSREDISDKLEVFCLGKKENSFEDLDSKQKAAFTREYNAGSHRSQALVREQGGANKVKQKGRSVKEKDPNDLDAIDEDDVGEEEEEDEEDDEETEMKKLQEQFKKKGRKKPTTDKAAAPKKSRSKK